MKYFFLIEKSNIYCIIIHKNPYKSEKLKKKPLELFPQPSFLPFAFCFCSVWIRHSETE